MALQFVVVNFEESRELLVDGDPNGRTHESIRVGEGTHEFALGGEQNYSPESIEVQVTGTSSLDPLELQFHLNSGDA